MPPGPFTNLLIENRFSSLGAIVEHMYIDRLNYNSSFGIVIVG